MIATTQQSMNNNSQQYRGESSTNYSVSRGVARKYILDLGDGEKVEILYPNLPTFGNQSVNFIKNIFIMVDPSKHRDGPNDSLCKSLLGVYTDVVFDVESQELKVIIKGFVPNGPCYKHKRLRIGDLLVSINDFYVNANNIEGLLSAIKQPRCIKLSIQSPLKYTRLSEVEHLPKKVETSVQVASRSTDIVKGDRTKEAPVTYDIPHSLMILSLQHDDKSQDKNSKKVDLLYKFPANHDLFVTVRGMFLTLAGIVQDIDRSEVRCCTLRFNNQLLNVSFIVNFSTILVIAVPNECIDQYTLKSLTNDLKTVIEFTYGSLKKSLEEKNCKKNFDNLFSLFFQRLLLKNDLLNMKSIRYNEDLKLKIFNALPWFELSNTIKVNVDLKLSAFEAQEFVDADGLYYKNRRLFNILGCCLFFKTYLTSTHLSMELTKKIYKFCDNNGLFILSSNVITNQFFIWKEVYVTGDRDRQVDDMKNVRHYILIVGYREFIFASLIEFGNVSRRIDDSIPNIQADPYLIDQAKMVLNDMLESGVMNDINEWYTRGSLPHVVSVDKVFNTQKDRSASLKNRPRSQLANQYIKDIKANDKPFKTLGKMVVPVIPKEFDSLCVFNQIPESSLYDSVFHYVYSEENSAGILISPYKHDVEQVDSLFYFNVMSNFSSSCVKIKNLFELQENKFNPFILSNDLIEQGILFTLCKASPQRSRSKSKNNDTSDNKRAQSVETNEPKEENVLNYWVVGRRLQSGNHKKDLFICFHDSVNDIIQEIAFDLGFSRFYS